MPFAQFILLPSVTITLRQKALMPSLYTLAASFMTTIMLKRDDYVNIIEDIRNTEKISIDEYIEKHLIPLQADNQFFIETLYKDIVYVLNGLDKAGDNDLVIENGDLAIEDGDFKLSGYQTRLHDILVWLHMEIVQRFASEIKYPNELSDKIENFEKNVLNKTNYTPEYKSKLDKIHQSLKKERSQNHEKKSSWIKKIIDPDNLELKPNIAGIGINLNEIINKFRK